MGGDRRYVPDDVAVRAPRRYSDGTYAIIGPDGRVVATSEQMSDLLPDLRQLEIECTAFLAKFDGGKGVFRRAKPPFEALTEQE